MKQTVFIVHKSEVIRKGLLACLGSPGTTEVTLLKNLSELENFFHIVRSHIVLIAEAPNGSGSALISQLQSHNKLDFVEVDFSVSDSPSIHETKNLINTKSSSSEVRKMILNLLDFEEGLRSPKEKENELSQREQEVLRLVALGHSNKEIADQLFISIHTVISHRKNITEKLGIKSISGLTVYALLNKIIDPDTINPENLI